jgi:hypothetical protein
LTPFRISSSVETIGERCFEHCCKITTITFGDSLKFNRIGEHAFAQSGLTSIAIPASTQEIDGSAFVRWPLIELRVAPGSRNFMTGGNLRLTWHGTEIVRYFGRELEVLVPKEVELIAKPCFAGYTQVEGVFFEGGSKLLRIGRSAFH